MSVRDHRETPLLASIVLFAGLLLSACGGGGGGGGSSSSTDNEAACAWNETAWDECDWG